MPTDEHESRFDGPATMPSDECGWWEHERATWIRSRLRQLSGPKSLLLDVGCGRGTMFDDQTLDDRVLVRVDSHVWDEWRRGEGLYVCASADALPFRDGAFDVVGSFDVLEHLGDDAASLMEQSRVTADDGHLVAAVPADRRLWSHHDVSVGHLRRYADDDLASLAARVGLDPERVTHFYSFLWLPAWLTRNAALRTSEPGNETSLMGRILRRAVGVVAAIERRFLRRWDLPFGTSLWVEWRPADRPAPTTPTANAAAATDDLTTGLEESSSTMSTETRAPENNTGIRSILTFAWAYEGFQRSVGKNKLRRRFVDEFVGPSAGDRVLDIGCGPGDLVPFLPDIDYTGFDVSSGYVRAARNRFGNRATFVDGSFDELATSIEGTIDIAVTVGVLHHVDDDTAHELLAGAYRSLRPGGRFVALEPHLHDAQHRVARELIMRDRGQHVRSEGEYLTLIEEHFDDIDVRRDEHMLRIPYTVSMYTCRKPL